MENLKVGIKLGFKIDFNILSWPHIYMAAEGWPCVELRTKLPNQPCHDSFSLLMLTAIAPFYKWGN